MKKTLAIALISVFALTACGKDKAEVPETVTEEPAEQNKPAETIDIDETTEADIVDEDTDSDNEEDIEVEEDTKEDNE